MKNIIFNKFIFCSICASWTSLREQLIFIIFTFFFQRKLVQLFQDLVFNISWIILVFDSLSDSVSARGNLRIKSKYLISAPEGGILARIYEYEKQVYVQILYDRRKCFGQITSLAFYCYSAILHQVLTNILSF